MATSTDALQAAREALSDYRWQDAYDLAVAVADSGPEGRDLLADAAFFLGRWDDCIAAREQAFAEFEAAGLADRAAELAAKLCDLHNFAGRSAVAGGWLARARRLSAGLDDSPGLALVLVREVEVAHGSGDLDRAAELAQQVLDMGRRLGSPDLEAEGLQALGRVRLAAGEVDAGMALLDEAMLPVIEGRLSPAMTGRVYCSMMGACTQVGDHQRATEWTEAGNAWVEGHPMSAYPGLCRIYLAEALDRRGQWAEAETTALRAHDDLLTVSPGFAAYALGEVGDVRLRLGDLDGAEEAYRLAEVTGGNPQPGLSLLLLARDRVDEARAAIDATLDDVSWNRLERARLLPAQVRIHLAAGDLEGARQASEELTAIAAAYTTAGLEAEARTAAGRILLSDGEPAEARTALRAALQRWQQLGVPYAIATVQLLLARASRALGDEDGCTSYLDAAVRAFEDLGAAADRDRATALRTSDAALPDGLTEREAEVLRLVAQGLTNKQIGAELYLSHKTVARHLSNIFLKTGVTSRTAAATYAHERGVI